MNIDKHELSTRLIKHGLRPTSARLLILALLIDNNNHMNTDGILKTLQEKGNSVSVATLYQNLEKLVEVGLLKRFKNDAGLMLFDANLAPHSHLVCASCGKMEDVKITHESLLSEPPISFQNGTSFSNWQIDNLKIEYQGTCPNCQKKNK